MIDYKQLKYTNNTHTVPGVAPGVMGYTNPSKNYQKAAYNLLLSPYAMMKSELGNKSFIGSDFDKTINSDSGIPQTDRTPELLGMEDPYTKNPNLKATTNNLANGVGGALGKSNLGGVMSSATDAVSHIYDSWTNYDDVEKLQSKYTSKPVNIAGVNTQLLFKAKDGKLPKYASGTVGNIIGSVGGGASTGAQIGGGWGALIGAVVGGIGSGLGEWYSAGKLKINEKYTNHWANNINQYRVGEAFTNAMRTNYAMQHGDQSQQYLYGYSCGKLPKYTPGKLPEVDPKTGLTKRSYLTDTAYGTLYMPANGLGKPGEVMSDLKTGVSKEIAPGLPGSIGDKIPIFADKNTAILTDDWIDPVTKKTYALAAKDGDDTIQNLVDRMAQYVNPAKLTKYAKNGKLPKFKEGAWANAAISGIGALAGLTQYIDAKRNKPYRPHTYVENPYESSALSTLAGLDINPYPIVQQMRNAETRTNKAIDRSGGLSTAQRNLSRLSALYGTLNNIANTLASIQQQRNQYKANYAQAALNAGNASRQARMSANQFDLDYYSKAHAAQLAGMQTGVQNMLAQAQGWYRNDFKRRQFNDTMGLYRAQQAQDLSALQAQSNQFMQQMALANKQLDLQKQLNSYLDILNDRAKFMEAMELAKKKGWISA